LLKPPARRAGALAARGSPQRHGTAPAL